jgi:pyruvate/2-oxoglutarate dehydrogenase complex dihydrolipoamide acyltransferase (E2) component
MRKNHNDYKVVPYSETRRLLSLMMGSMRRKHMVHDLIEVDVTKARQYLRDHKARTGESLSFTAFITSCLARAVDENKSLHVCRKGRKHLVLFEEVDVATQIEREVGGQKQNITYIIRAANKKTFHEIHHEIRTAQVQEVEKAWTASHAFHWILFLPILLFRIYWWIFWQVCDTYPNVQKKYGGTVGISAVGMMFGKGPGWGIPIAYHTLDITLGGIAEKPAVVDGRIEPREYLYITLIMNHDSIDGTPAARFTMRLKELIESGIGLIDEGVEPVQTRRTST